MLLTTGIYRMSRNPMYLGHAVLLLAWLCWLQNVAAMAVLPLFMACITRLQIVPEERALAERFPEQYAQWQARVRRWL